MPIDGEKISLEYFRLSVNTFFEDYYDDLQPRDEETDLDDTVSIFLEAYKNRVIED